MPRYFLKICLENPSFRLPSLQSVCDLYDFQLRIVSEDAYRGILVVDVEEEQHIQHLLDRGIQVMSACELYAEGSSYEELHAAIRSDLSRYDPYRDSSFRFTVEASNYHIPGSRIRETVKSFSYIDLKGEIKMRDAEVEWVVFEDYDFKVLNTYEGRLARDGQFSRVYFGRRIGLGRARNMISAHSVKTREFYGNTSMESEMGFLMASQALPSPGKIVYDPFVGTGSLLYACAHWGAYVLGSDIDGRQMRGKGKGREVVPGIMRAAAQYGVADKFLGLYTGDMTQHPLRRGGWIDAIVTDPPYGVRAGAKRLGKRENRPPARDEAYILPDGTPGHQLPYYVPPSRPYELTHLTLDLLRLARYLLVPRGRLVFFLPTTSEEYKSIKLPPVEGMREVEGEGDCIQDFGSWGRRMITMEKTADDDGDPPHFTDYSLIEEVMPGIKTFQERYWDSFKKNPRNTTSAAAAVPNESDASDAKAAVEAGAIADVTAGVTSLDMDRTNA